MPKFRKKPIVVEARQYDGNNAMDIVNWINENGGRAIKFQDFFKVATLEGDTRIVEGDWIIRGVADEFYPCKPDIFEQTYEPVNNA